ncbi:MAG: putative 7-carboxy-7-deazaguanine synthase [Prokaryotic dsDNA virus sp.]|nr:MAG: putative 7-carboxy-7-deazaguanine synthase [Prokaryotic dsDNA virus sp.]|tara:strand:+ start:2911 stop:3606 length:696 start_codon:yes stop_codon:yes gene_type:complete
MKELRVSEWFYSIQGEGKTMGIPSLFIRLQACNIVCDGEWTCDTIEVWKHGDKISHEDFLDELDPYIYNLYSGAHLVFTGGEPLIQKKGIIQFIETFKKRHKFIPFIEIETNGTKSPKGLEEYIDLWNCSFKLANSGVELRRRIVPKCLQEINKLNSIFKIVIGKEEDWKEAELIILGNDLDNKKIYLMPSAEDMNQLTKNNQLVAEICKKHTLKYSSRLQITLWNKTTGV